jgi:hypothetical protein
VKPRAHALRNRCQALPATLKSQQGESRLRGLPLEGLRPGDLRQGQSRQSPATRVLALLLFCLAALAPGAAAQLLEKRVTPLAPLDRQYMETQRQRVTDMTLRYYGGRCCRRSAELDYLQRLLDDGHVTPDQTSELQAMGVLLGDLLAAELDMHWVVYEDAKGRSRALQLGETDNYLFPVTMISRRREAGDQTPIVEIHQRALESIEAVRPPLPFQ